MAMDQPYPNLSLPILRDPVTGRGRLELRYYLREQSMTELLHRYGNIISKLSA